MRLPLLSLLLLSGCAANGGLVKMADVSHSDIHWIRERPQDCGKAGNFNGCAWRMDNYSKCSIVMPEDAPDWVVAEEFKHCFGYEHINNQ